MQSGIFLILQMGTVVVFNISNGQIKRNLEIWLNLDEWDAKR